MTTLEDIEKAVLELPTEQLAKFRAWFEQLEAARFDQNIERDAKAGRTLQKCSGATAPPGQYSFAYWARPLRIELAAKQVASPGDSREWLAIFT